jgi:penicillin-binding protein activator
MDSPRGQMRPAANRGASTMRRTHVLAALLVVLLGTWGCGPPGPATTVQRTDAKAQVDLSGNWNDTDANLVAQTMIRDCLSRPWASAFKAEKGRPPVVRLYPIKNRSSDDIQTKYFTKQVEMELINSGIAKVVSDLEESNDNLTERADQARHASDKTAKQQQQETGSDFILNGWIVTQNDAAGGQEVRAYITTMELSNTESNEKVWMKIHPIKKVISRAATQW